MRFAVLVSTLAAVAAAAPVAGPPAKRGRLSSGVFTLVDEAGNVITVVEETAQDVGLFMRKRHAEAAAKPNSKRAPLGDDLADAVTGTTETLSQTATMLIGRKRHAEVTAKPNSKRGELPKTDATGAATEAGTSVGLERRDVGAEAAAKPNSKRRGVVHINASGLLAAGAGALNGAATALDE